MLSGNINSNLFKAVQHLNLQLQSENGTLVLTGDRSKSQNQEEVETDTPLAPQGSDRIDIDLRRAQKQTIENAIADSDARFNSEVVTAELQTLSENIASKLKQIKADFNASHGEDFERKAQSIATEIQGLSRSLSSSAEDPAIQDKPYASQLTQSAEKIAGLVEEMDQALKEDSGADALRSAIEYAQAVGAITGELSPLVRAENVAFDDFGDMGGDVHTALAQTLQDFDDLQAGVSYLEGYLNGAEQELADELAAYMQTEFAAVATSISTQVDGGTATAITQSLMENLIVDDLLQTSASSTDILSQIHSAVKGSQNAALAPILYQESQISGIPVSGPGAGLPSDPDDVDDVDDVDAVDPIETEPVTGLSAEQVTQVLGNIDAIITAVDDAKRGLFRSGREALERVNEHLTAAQSEIEDGNLEDAQALLARSADLLNHTPGRNWRWVRDDIDGAIAAVQTVHDTLGEHTGVQGNLIEQPEAVEENETDRTGHDSDWGDSDWGDSDGADSDWDSD
jgi:hypothetical protein